jgi:hypothetical protein
VSPERSAPDLIARELDTDAGESVDGPIFHRAKRGLSTKAIESTL